jgi:hypothetical protein
MEATRLASDDRGLLTRAKKAVPEVEPRARVILFGSRPAATRAAGRTGTCL